MQTDLARLLAGLKEEQRKLILIAATVPGLPNRSTIQRIGELEQAIGATEFALGEPEGFSDTD